MADMIAEGLAYLADVFAEQASATVTYQRGEGDSLLTASMPVTWGTSTNLTTDGSEVVDEFEIKDALIRATDLVLGGVQVAPLDGDRIIDGDGIVYTVQVPPAAEQAAVQDDGYNSQWQVHTWRRMADS